MKPINLFVPIIFSGHNERAVVALCRFFSSVGRDFFIIANNNEDAILATDWAPRVILVRQTTKLNLDLMDAIAKLIQARGFIPSLCPTSEFLNNFFLDNHLYLKPQGWHWLFPTTHVYGALTNKESSQAQVERLVGLRAPQRQQAGQWCAPCVLKPLSNIFMGRTLYPKLCFTDNDLKKALSQIDEALWFSQDWVDGQSFYLCAYIDGVGYWDAFWQENLIQQPDGKSIVLARSCGNPGVDLEQFMGGLHEFGYRGPLMMEVIRDQSQKMHYIEINPRFWGPLDLTRQACPAILHRYLADLDGQSIAMTYQEPTAEYFYAWALGAKCTPLKLYPAAKLLTWKELDHLLYAYDVYSHSDTKALALRQ